MAEELGEVRVNIEEEGAQDAADTIGEAVSDAEPGDGIGAGAGTAGRAGLGAILTTIVSTLGAILGFVAFLATLEPIQELFKGLQRLFTVAILPLVSLINAFLRPVLRKLLRFIGNANLDFSSIFSRLSDSIESALNNVVDGIAQGIRKSLPGGRNVSGDQVGSALGLAGALTIPGQRGNIGSSFRNYLDSLNQGSQNTGGNPGDNRFLNINIDGFSEQSNTSLDSNVTGTTNELTQKNGVGGQ